MTEQSYKGWTISYDPPPIPYRGLDWRAESADLEASLTAGSEAELREEIDLFLEEQEDRP